MNPKLLFTLAMVLSSAFGFLPRASAQTAAAAQAEQQQVRQAAESWLVLKDSGKDSDSWHALSSSASAKVTESKWKSAFSEERREFGSPTGRRFKEQHFFTKGQDGYKQDFYLVEFHAVSAERGAPLRELVRVVKDADGKWRVAGYDIERRRQGGENEDAD